MDIKSMGKCPKCAKIISEECHVYGRGKPKQYDMAVCGNCEALIAYQNTGQWLVIPDSYLSDMQRYEPMDYEMLMHSKRYALKRIKNGASNDAKE